MSRNCKAKALIDEKEETLVINDEKQSSETGDVVKVCFVIPPQKKITSTKIYFDLDSHSKSKRRFSVHLKDLDPETGIFGSISDVFVRGTTMVYHRAYNPVEEVSIDGSVLTVNLNTDTLDDLADSCGWDKLQLEMDLDEQEDERAEKTKSDQKIMS